MTTESQQSDARRRALELIRQYGWNNTSFQTLEPHFEYWFDPDGPGVVAYYRACFFGTLERFAAELGDAAANIKIGEQPWWDPQRWDQLAERRRTVGSQLRRAKRLGVSVRQIAATAMLQHDSPARRSAQSVIDAWLAAHRMATMSFVVHIDPFSFAEQRRYFLAEQRDSSGGLAPVGFLALVPVYARDGWFLEDLVRTPQAPNGTAEALIDAAMLAVALEGSCYATLGLSPLKSTGSSCHAQPRWAAMIFSLSRRMLDPPSRCERLA